MSNQDFFIVCVETGEDADLAIGRVYRAREDAAGARSGFIRVWDESGDDYLYPAAHFVRFDVAGTERDRLEGAIASR